MPHVTKDKLHLHVYMFKYIYSLVNNMKECCNKNAICKEGHKERNVSTTAVHFVLFPKRNCFINLKWILCNCN